MTVWIIVIGLALAAFAVIAFGFKAPRKGWEAIAAALVLGLAGFAYQARPEQPGAPKLAAEPPRTAGAALVKVRQELATGSTGSAVGAVGADRFTITADALTRQGHFADAAGLRLGTIKAQPRDAQAWLALANDLVGHADGALSPAALYAFGRASALDPQAPGPPFFLGLALAQNGRLTEARDLWAQLLARGGPQSSWHGGLRERLGLLDQLIAAQQTSPPGTAG